MIPKMDRIEGMRYGLVIGCGKEPMVSTPEMTWTNLDGDPAVKADSRIPVDCLHERYTGFFDKIIAKDILEHVPCTDFNPNYWMHVLRTWSWCLRPGGEIFVQVPDIEAIMAQFHAAAPIDLATVNRVIFGENTNAWDRHYRVFTLRELKAAMEYLGLEIVEAYNLHVCAMVTGRKR